MTYEAFQERIAERNYSGNEPEWAWPRVGDKVKFIGADRPMYPNYLDMKETARTKLEVGKLYTVKECEVYSSWCSITLEELSYTNFNLTLFEWPVQ